MNPDNRKPSQYAYLRPGRILLPLFLAAACAKAEQVASPVAPVAITQDGTVEAVVGKCSAAGRRAGTL